MNLRGSAKSFDLVMFLILNSLAIVPLKKYGYRYKLGSSVKSKLKRILEGIYIMDEWGGAGLEDEVLTAQGAKIMGVTTERFKDWRWQMSHQIRDYKTLGKFFPVEQDEKLGFQQLKEFFNAGISPYYAALQSTLSREKQKKIRLQAIPNIQEKIDPLGQHDPLSEVEHSPVKEVVHLYPDRVAFCVAMLCPVYCRYCYRKRRDDEEGLHFNREIIRRGIDYIASNPAIKDVLITGGDPFIASDQAIENLLQQLRSIKHVEIIRFGTRTPSTLPYRITEELCQKLKKYHPIWLNTHFNCVEELTPEAEKSLQLLVDHGIPVGNQSVFLKGVNDSVEQMSELCRKLTRNRVRPYYLFHPHLVEGTSHLRPSIKEGQKIIKGMRGNISGYAIPSYILDTPSGKVPINPNYVVSEDGNDLIVEGVRGELWREQGCV